MKPVSVLIIAAAIAAAACSEAREEEAYAPGAEPSLAEGDRVTGAAPGQRPEPEHVELDGLASYERALTCAGLYGRVVVLFPDRAVWAAPRIEAWSNAVLETGAEHDHDDARIMTDFHAASRSAETALPEGSAWDAAAAALAGCEAFER